MAWENKELMFPDGTIPTDSNLTLDDLIFQNIDVVSYDVFRMAREMIIQQEKLIWTKEGSFSRQEIYNVYQHPLPQGESALNVFGAKMLNNHLEKPIGKIICAEGASIDNDGFSYTGI